MSQSAKLDEQRLDTIKFQRNVILVMGLGIVVAIVGVILSFNARHIWVSPDLTAGQMIKANGPYRAYPYAFTYRLFDTVWTWREDAAKEFPRMLRAVEPYMGASVRRRLLEEFESLKSRGVHKERQRQIKEIIPADPSKMVQPISGERFVVYVDMEIIDSYKGSIVAWKRKRFAFIVDVDTSDMDNNKYGLKVMEYYHEPVSLDQTE